MNNTTLKNFKLFLKTIDIPLSIFFLPIIFGSLGAVFEGASFGLLIPTVKGIIEGHTHFVSETPYLKDFFLYIPQDLKDRSIKIFAILVVLTFISVVLKNLFFYLSTVASSFQVWRMSNGLRKKIFERYLSFGKLYFDQNNIGRLHELLTGYTKQISLHLKEANTSIFLFLVLIAYLLIMLKISWKLTLFVFLISPIFYFSMKSLIHKIKASSEAYIVNYSSLLKNLSNSLLCLPLVKSYAYEEQEKERFFKDSNRVEMNEFSIDKKKELINPLSEVLVTSLILVLVGIMAFLLYIRKEGDIASFMVYFLILKRSMGSFAAGTRLQAIFNAISGPMSEIREIFSDEGKFFVKEGTRIFSGLKEKIEIKNLHFSYPGNLHAIKNITLDIEKNKITAIVGPSGSGKSTLVNILLRFYDFKDGEVKVDGVDVRDFTLKSYLSKMAYISQEVFLFNDTLKNNLLYGLSEKSEEEINAAIDKSNLRSLVEKLPEGLNTEIGDRGVKLSGGEKQKLAMARAILKNCEILILDEATSSLDSISEKEIQKSILETSKSKTSIVIAHRLSTIKNADKIVVISLGEVVEEGTLETLLNKKGIFYKMWEEQKFF